MYCKHCGKQIPDHYKFCNSCGEPVVSRLHRDIDETDLLNSPPEYENPNPGKKSLSPAIVIVIVIVALLVIATAVLYVLDLLPFGTDRSDPDGDALPVETSENSPVVLEDTNPDEDAVPSTVVADDHPGSEDSVSEELYPAGETAAGFSGSPLPAETPSNAEQAAQTSETHSEITKDDVMLAYYYFMLSHDYISLINQSTCDGPDADWGEYASVYSVLDIDLDGIPELFMKAVSSPFTIPEWCYVAIFTYSPADNSVHLLSNHYVWSDIYYSPVPSSIGYTSVRNTPAVGGYTFYKLENGVEREIYHAGWSTDNNTLQYYVNDEVVPEEEYHKLSQVWYPINYYEIPE